MGCPEMWVHYNLANQLIRKVHTRLSPVPLSVFSLVVDLLFDCLRVLEYAKIRTVLQSILNPPELTNEKKNEGKDKRQMIDAPLLKDAIFPPETISKTQQV